MSALVVAEFEQTLRGEFQKIPGTRINFVAQGAGGGGGKGLEIVLTGEDPERLGEAAQALTQQMRQVPGLVEVSSTAALVQPEILIRPDPVRASDLGVSVSSIARTASLATLGDAAAESRLTLTRAIAKSPSGFASPPTHHHRYQHPKEPTGTCLKTAVLFHSLP